METTRTVESLRRHIDAWRTAGETIAMVPTMGAIHDGHLSLVRIARARADRVVTSLFVNPTQFGPAEDLAAYPADEAADAALLADAGCDLLYAPSGSEMYPDGLGISVTVAGLGDGLCGAHRPGHFDGVATVVARLLTQCAPDIAVFGEKDYQQLLVIRRLVRDLDLPVEIVGGPTVREADGLALSSRNAYLSETERRIAPALQGVLSTLAERVAGGAEPCGAACDAARAALLEAGFDTVDYVEIRAGDTLAPMAHAGPGARAFGAVHIGDTRLIDNLPIG
ncbi:MAG: pantoate--beta-alanine ligase [Alphaproteobacteria bacterium]